MPHTIREVAKRAEVSVSTVSRVLNDYPFVSDAVRSRVLQAMEELDYRPDVAARSMRTGTSRAVGFVVSDITNPVFSAIAKGADLVLHERGHLLVLANSGNDPEHEAELMATLRQRRVEGLIIAVADERAQGLARRLASFHACVLFDRRVEGSGADAVVSDHAAGMADALAYLAGLGHRRIGLIAGRPGQLGSRARITAYRRLAGRFGLDRDRALVETGELSHTTGYEGAQALLALDEPPTAIVAGNNQVTAGVLEALRDLSVRVPTDLSLIGTDDVYLTRLHDPPIDVIDRDLIAHGEAAARLLLQRLADSDTAPRTVTLPVCFTPRGSTAPPARQRARASASVS
jgi:LacI family transcriptional regulator